MALTTFTSFTVKVADHIPLKQGLRHRIIAKNAIQTCVADHIPLKQGLRLESVATPHLLLTKCRRPYSIKTRIKTFCKREYKESEKMLSQTIFH